MTVFDIRDFNALHLQVGIYVDNKNKITTEQFYIDETLFSQF